MNYTGLLYYLGVQSSLDLNLQGAPRLFKVEARPLIIFPRSRANVAPSLGCVGHEPVKDTRSANKFPRAVQGEDRH